MITFYDTDTMNDNIVNFDMIMIFRMCLISSQVMSYKCDLCKSNQFTLII